jgi:hypothetical protein
LGGAVGTRLDRGKEGTTLKPTDETKRFWLMAYAMDGFRNVISACEYLLDNDFQLTSPIYRHLATAILTMYGRPFHNNYGVGKLDSRLVPEKYRNLHEQLIYERDKIHAHADAKGVPSRIGNANQVRLLRAAGGFKWTVSSYLPYERQDLLDLCELCRTLIRKLDYHTDKYEKKCLKEIKRLPEGEYVLNVDLTAQTLFDGVQSVFPADSNLKLTPI